MLAVSARPLVPFIALSLLVCATTPALAQTGLGEEVTVSRHSDPADQPPFGGATVPPRIPSGKEAPPGFELTASDVRAIVRETDEWDDLGEDDAPRFMAVATRGDKWEVLVRNPEGEIKAIIVIDDSTGQVIDVFTEEQVDTKLARGYEDAIAGDLNEWWFWLPLCLLFVAPFFDFRRPLRLLHLDLLMLLGFSVSLFFFNKGEIDLSAPLVYPFLAYLFVRMLLAGFRPSESREPLLPHARRSWVVVGIVALVGLQTWFAVSEAKVIDVGIAGVIGADRLSDGEDIYSEDFDEGLPESGDVRGDVYGPVNYGAYVPFEQALPYEGDWDDVPAARAASLAFSLLTALALFGLGRRLRERDEGTTLGIALAFAWLAYPFTLYTLGSSFNDSLVALGVVLCLLAISSPAGRGALLALAGLTKFGPFALVPLFAAGTGDRRLRTLAIFGGSLLLVSAVLVIPVIPDGGLSEMYDRSLGYQASRGSPFSIWGQAPALEPLQTAAKVFAVGLAIAVFFVPKRRSPVQVAALAAAVLIAIQATTAHWFYPYAVWFAPLVLAALFAAQRGPEPAVGRPRDA